MDHLRKRHNLGLFARMGGPFVRHFFLLEIFGDQLIPEEITELLGVSPGQSYRKGDERPRGSQHYNTGGWVLKSGELVVTEESCGEERFDAWVSELPADYGVWKSIRERFEVRVRLVGYTDQWNAEFVVSPRAMGELAARGLPLMLDPYLALWVIFHVFVLAPPLAFALYGVISGKLLAVSIAFFALLGLVLWRLFSQARLGFVYWSICRKMVDFERVSEPESQ